jgi:hypothetical protein
LRPATSGDVRQYLSGVGDPTETLRGKQFVILYTFIFEKSFDQCTDVSQRYATSSSFLGAV